MKTKVAIVRCDDYKSENVRKAIIKAMDLLGDAVKFDVKGRKVLIKPNLCLPAQPDDAITTHPEVVKQVALLFKKEGADITIGDNPVGKPDNLRMEQIIRNCGLKDILDETGDAFSNLNTNKIKHKSLIRNKWHVYYLAQEAVDASLVINIPKFKTHCLMTFTGAVKNLYGVVPGGLKKKLHGELPAEEDFANMLLDIYTKISPGLHIMDAVYGLEGDGPGYQGEKRKIGLILASTEGLALDICSAYLMGISPDGIVTNRLGCARNLEKADLDKIEVVGEDIHLFRMTDYKLPTTFRYTSQLTQKVFELAKLRLKIEFSKCARCRLCLSVCPVNAIREKNEMIQIKDIECISCMSCQEICPNAAIKASRYNFYEQLSNLSNREQS